MRTESKIYENLFQRTLVFLLKECKIDWEDYFGIYLGVVKPPARHLTADAAGRIFPDRRLPRPPAAC